MEFRYRRLVLTTDELNHLNKLIATHPHWRRRKLAKQVCEDFNWRQHHGYFKELVCRSFVVELNRSGYIQLPAVTCRPNNPLANRTKPTKITVDEKPIDNANQIAVVQVRNTPHKGLYDSLIEQYHYLGYVHPIGEYRK